MVMEREILLLVLLFLTGLANVWFAHTSWYSKSLSCNLTGVDYRIDICVWGGHEHYQAKLRQMQQAGLLGDFLGVPKMLPPSLVAQFLISPAAILESPVLSGHMACPRSWETLEQPDCQPGMIFHWPSEWSPDAWLCSLFWCSPSPLVWQLGDTHPRFLLGSIPESNSAPTCTSIAWFTWVVVVVMHCFNFIKSWNGMAQATCLCSPRGNWAWKYGFCNFQNEVPVSLLSTWCHPDR